MILSLLMTACTSLPAGDSGDSGDSAETLRSPGFLPDDVTAEDADLRPAARYIAAVLAEGGPLPTLDEVRRATGASTARSTYDFEPPTTIRVWRMSMGGASSCDGPVETLDFDDYVKGVLPQEWISSWEDESLRAGAVAIRTYSAYYVNIGGKYDCADICDTTSCQVYDDTRLSVTNAAVDDTEGEYVVDGSSLTFAQYSAENGDPTADGVDDPYCSGESVFGHGHGVCQWGTQRWALYGGKDHEWILEHYYPGSSVAVVGGDKDEDGYTEDDGDCNDDDPTVHPGARELCDHTDSDCDGDLEDGYDADGDGFRTCDGDCDDSDRSRHPGATEVADGADNDCDFRVDEGTSVYDDDGDGFTETGGDCDDTDHFRFPGAPETLDGADDDCDGLIDEGTSACDDDGDGLSEAAGDCVDVDATIHPGAAELANGRDDNCDGAVDEGTQLYDDDGDSFTDVGGDCDDADWQVFPGAAERVNGKDDNCDGQVDEQPIIVVIEPDPLEVDDDGDGWSEATGDCGDTDPETYPGAAEVIDATDNDCDGVVDDHTTTFDDDGDGVTEAAGDCNDHRRDIFPGAPESLDHRDNDCDGVIDDDTEAFDDDHDGWTELAGDCDDHDVARHPGAGEQLDGRDNDCDTITEVEQGWFSGCASSPPAPLALFLAPLWLRRRVRRPHATNRREGIPTRG